MSQNDFNLANQGFPSMRADMNSALQALASNSAGATEPSTTYAYQWWYDETTDILKMRNADNDAWISFATFDQATDTFTITTDNIDGLTATATELNKLDGVTNDAASYFTASGALSNRNRIINGSMTIDQRNAGASVANPAAAAFYTLDRWAASGTQASKFTVQQNAGAVTPPAGFTNYLGVTSSSAYTVTGNESNQLYQVIEGFNTVGLNWGTASALPATLSFWARSSLTGTFGGSIATTKTSVWSMPFEFTISSANTWTYITVPITAPTATGGTNTDNTVGIFVRFGFGCAGTSLGGTVGVWGNNNFVQPAGTVSLLGTNGATFYITGVQLEVGDTATPFEHRSYGQELALCQRYYFYESESIYGGRYGSSSGFAGFASLPVTMRVQPTLSYQSVRTTTGLAAYSSPNSAQYLMGDISPFVQGLSADAEL